jgi:hypothetical protein
LVSKHFQLRLLRDVSARWQSHETEKVIRLLRALVDESAFAYPTPTLTSHQRGGLLAEKPTKFLPLVTASDVAVLGIHVDFVPEMLAPILAPNQHHVNFVPKVNKYISAPK